MLAEYTEVDGLAKLSTLTVLSSKFLIEVFESSILLPEPRRLLDVLVAGLSGTPKEVCDHREERSSTETEDELDLEERF